MDQLKSKTCTLNLFWSWGSLTHLHHTHLYSFRSLHSIFSDQAQSCPFIQVPPKENPIRLEERAGKMEFSLICEKNSVTVAEIASAVKSLPGVSNVIDPTLHTLQKCSSGSKAWNPATWVEYRVLITEQRGCPTLQLPKSFPKIC